MPTIIGVDIGQKIDPTAICVAEPEYRAVDGRGTTHYVIRHLERLRLGTPYPRVAERILSIASKVARHTGSHPRLYIDATGVGTPVVDLLRERAPRIGQVIAVYFTAGGHLHEKGSRAARRMSLGKAHMVSRLQALLQNGHLHLPRTSEANALSLELLNFEIRVDKDSRDRYGAFRFGTHDDLVTALGLAVQSDATGPPV